MSTIPATRTATIIVGMLPPCEVNQNWHGSWRRRSAATAEFREEAGWATKAAVSEDFDGFLWVPSAPRIILDCEIAWCGRRKAMDDGNAKAALKALVDGVADVLWDGDDSRVEMGEVRQVRGEGTCTVFLREGA